MLRFFRSKIAILMLTIIPFSMTACDDETTKEIIDAVAQYIEKLLDMLGLNIDVDDYNNSPDNGGDIYDDTDTFDASKSWESCFPPIGNQGSYGTCVAWASGYAMKSALNKKDNPSLNMNNASNQISPVDLWQLIDASSKSTSCDGTSFDPAFKVMMNKGVASMAEKPFTNSKMTCDGITGTGNSSNKLGSYRIIAYTNELSQNGSQGMTIENLKGYLNDYGPIVIGARLGDNFMNCSNSSVLTYDTYTYSGPHAYHAMVLVGYDDSKQAFRVRNSWGSDWGNNGSIWIGYNFFVKSFCFGAWIASNSSLSYTSVNRSGSATDLQMEIVKDYENSDGSRTVEYDIKNTGTTIISSEKNWSAIYLLFRVNRLSEKYILFHDFYGKTGSNGSISSYADGLAVSSANTATNIDIQPKKTAAETVIKDGDCFTFNYLLPLDKNGKKLDGDFYMVLIADAFGDIDESDEENNFCFLTGKEGEPIRISNGKIMNITTARLTDVRSLVSEKTPNNYTGIEIQQVLQKQLNKGILKKLVFQQKKNELRSGTIAKKVKK